MEQSPTDFLATIVIAALLGVAGQGVRVIAGLKKMLDAQKDNANDTDPFKSRQLFISLFVSLIIGLVSGILSALYISEPLSKNTYLAFVAAGYAGTDFIEGILLKNPILKPQAQAADAKKTDNTNANSEEKKPE